MSKTTCPACGALDAEELAEEVDIGVGIQRYVRGIICNACRSEIALCDGCGIPLLEGAQKIDHHVWCRLAMETKK